MTLVKPIAIRASAVCKTFRVYLNPSDVLRELFSRKPHSIERHALSNVSFEVRQGEVVGILGRNGAGKSTLLKIIAGTLDRSAGELEINGRITAILELGTGFHPEYSGRENIRLGGLCLGMNRDEIERKTESIIDFSELRDVIDQPFRTYSTGMQARLTFATAISVDPDILIIDEALSVGDARFQMKCFSRISELREQGRTILLVSHDTGTVTTFCDRAIVLENGAVFGAGSAREMSAAYLRLLFGERPADQAATVQPDSGVTAVITTAAPATAATEETASQLSSSSSVDSDGAVPTAPSAQSSGESVPAPPTVAAKPLPVEAGAVPTRWDGATTIPMPPHRRFGDGALRIQEFGLRDERGIETRVLESGAPCHFHMSATCVRPIERVSCGFAIKDRRGTVLFGVTNVAQAKPIETVTVGETVDIHTGLTMWLAAGDYFINLGYSHLHNGEMCDFLEDGIQFRVFGPGGIFTTAIVNLEADFRLVRRPAGSPAGAGSDDCGEFAVPG